MIALIQARSDSTRFPGKYKAMLGKLSISEMLYRTVISVVPETYFIVPDEDVEIQEYFNNLLIPFFTGPFEPLLRYHTVISKLRHETDFIRLTGDCPVLDPSRLFYMINLHKMLRADFTSNCNPENRFEIDGNDIEIMSRKTVNWLNQYARGSDREHVTAHVYINPKYAEREQLRCVYWRPPINLFDMVKLSVDTQEDLDRIAGLMEAPFNNVPAKEPPQ